MTKPRLHKRGSSYSVETSCPRIDRRKSNSSNEQSVEALVFGGRSYESPWVEVIFSVQKTRPKLLLVVTRGLIFLKKIRGDLVFISWTNGQAVIPESKI